MSGRSSGRSSGSPPLLWTVSVRTSSDAAEARAIQRLGRKRMVGHGCGSVEYGFGTVEEAVAAAKGLTRDFQRQDLIAEITCYYELEYALVLDDLEPEPPRMGDAPRTAGGVQ